MVAIWMVAKQDGYVKLTYLGAGTVKQCGSGPVALEGDLLAWVVDQAQPWSDAISTERGVFFKQTMPFGTN